MRGGRMGRDGKEVLQDLRDAIQDKDDERVYVLIDEAGLLDLSAVERIDILERAAIGSGAGIVQHVIDVLRPPYAGFAYALSLRYANEGAARFFARNAYDLLEDAPDEGREQKLERFDLTRSSPNLLLDLVAPSVATEVFSAPCESEQLTGPDFPQTTDLAATCELVLDLVSRGSFDSVVVDDLFRAAIAEVHMLKGVPAGNDHDFSSILIDFCGRMLDLHRTYGFGSTYLDLLLANLIRPHVSPEVVAFIAAKAPETMLSALETRHWLRSDMELVKRIARAFPADSKEKAGPLVVRLAEMGAVSELSHVLSWPKVLTPEVTVRAVDAATDKGHAECALLLLSHAPTPNPHPLAGLKEGVC